MLEQWLLVQDHYLLTHLFHIFNLLREVICLRVLKRVCMQLLMWIHQNILLTTTSLGIPPPMVGPELINPMERVIPIHGIAHSGQREQVSLTHETLKLQVGPPSSEIIGEGVAIFTDMTETILDILDKQIATSPSSQQQTKGLSLNDNQTEVIKSKEQKASPQKEDYPDLYLPIMENYRISDHFHGYLDSLSTDNNPMVLVELNNLS